MADSPAFKEVLKRSIAKEKYEMELSAIVLEGLANLKKTTYARDYHNTWMEDKHTNDVEFAHLKMKRHAIELAYLYARLLKD